MIDKLLNDIGISHATLLQLEHFVSLVLKWNKSINVIGKSTEQDIWQRHILDSLQLMSSIKKNSKLLDIGTGAGFPGMILSIVGIRDIYLVEKNTKKCAFLQQAKSSLLLDCHIINEKIEDSALPHFDIITCRAFASVEKTLNLTSRLITSSTALLLLKGENYLQEIQEAQDKGWHFAYNERRSITNKSSVILSIYNIKRKWQQ